MNNEIDTIVAIATPPGFGGIGVVRLSGPQSHHIAELIVKKPLRPRMLCHFYYQDQCIDQGIVLLFKAPHSFTGEDVVEFQGHGSPWAQAQLLQACEALGARMAQPGEFSKRSFLNGQLDLNQAEAIADLIHASSAQAARSAMQSLRGVFSEKVNQLMQSLRRIRIFLEASLDFSEEDITLLERQTYSDQLNQVVIDLKKLRSSAEQGCLQQQGLSLAIAGPANAGKSSLLNGLSDESIAIVSELAGTTRDIIKNSIQLDGLPIHLIDTAGWRESDDPIEQEGQRRAKSATETADLVVWVSDGDDIDVAHSNRVALVGHLPCIYVMNKTDLRNQSARFEQHSLGDCVFMSAKTGDGMDLLRQAIKEKSGYINHEEGMFIARRRHCQALEQAHTLVMMAQKDMDAGQSSECVAQSCYLAHQALATITGRADVEDLLDGIFSEFCIGK